MKDGRRVLNSPSSSPAPIAAGDVPDAPEPGDSPPAPRAPADYPGFDYPAAYSRTADEDSAP